MALRQKMRIILFAHPTWTYRRLIKDQQLPSSLTEDEVYLFYGAKVSEWDV